MLEQYALAALGSTVYQNNKPVPLNYLLKLTRTFIFLPFLHSHHVAAPRVSRETHDTDDEVALGDYNTI